jgi:hypothetical protein
MTNFSGSLAFDFDIEELKKEEFWNKVYQFDKKNYIMSASSGSTQ